MFLNFKKHSVSKPQKYYYIENVNLKPLITQYITVLL